MSSPASTPTDPANRPLLPAMTIPVMMAGVAIVAAAAWLRLWNIGAGIPHSLGPDEPQIMNRVAHIMKSGDFNPHFFDWPSLTIYLNLIVSCATFLAGAMRGLWGNLDQVPAADLYLAGRQFTALVGAATVALTFAIGRRWGNGVALASAALMAVISSHVRESHYVLTDVPTAFFTALTLLLSLRAYEQPTTRRLLWAAASAGLAASCKYNGSMAIVLPLIVVWTSGSGGLGARVPRTLAVLGAALAAFLVGTPYAVLDLPAFLNDYARLASTFARERGGEAGWSIYLKHVLSALSWPALVLAVAGVFLVMRRVLSGPARVPSLMLLAFSAVYFVVMARSYQIYGRYLLPLFPPLSLFAAVAAVSVAGRLRRRLREWPMGATAAGAAVVVLMLAAPATASWSFSRGLSRPSTVDLAYQWMMANLPPDGKVVIEAGALRLPDRYQVVAVRFLIDRSFDDYAREGVTHLLAASPQFDAMLRDPRVNPDVSGAYRALLSRTAEAAAFEPSATVSGPRIRVYQLPR
jgi:4-amino-4-deoxy-L-arabinose transferase-like glycosyltransferase